MDYVRHLQLVYRCCDFARLGRYTLDDGYKFCAGLSRWRQSMQAMGDRQGMVESGLCKLTLDLRGTWKLKRSLPLCCA